MDFAQIAKERVSQYSTVNNNLNYSTVQYSDEALDKILDNLADVVNRPYYPWYRRKLEELGSERFIQLANFARAGSDTPRILFRWMLTHPNEVNEPERALA